MTTVISARESIRGVQRECEPAKVDVCGTTVMDDPDRSSMACIGCDTSCDECKCADRPLVAMDSTCHRGCSMHTGLAMDLGVEPAAGTCRHRVGLCRCRIASDVAHAPDFRRNHLDRQCAIAGGRWPIQQAVSVASGATHPTVASTMANGDLVDRFRGIFCGTQHGTDREVRPPDIPNHRSVAIEELQSATQLADESPPPSRLPNLFDRFQTHPSSAERT